VKLKVTKEKCKGCSIFEDSEYKENMLKNDICGKRDMIGCPRDKI